MFYDLIIVGGGLVGAGLALALRQSDLRIALVDAKPPTQDDPRLFALNALSCQLLENLGVWTQLARHAAPIHQVHVSRQGHFGALRLDREDVQLPSLGHVIPAHFIEAVLNEALMMLSNVNVYRPAILKELQQQNGQATLTVMMDGNENILQSPLVIGADGTHSTVREQLNIATKTIDYDQSAIVTRTTLQRSHHHVAYERFNANGAIAMLPLNGHECATIWTADNATISQLSALSHEFFLQQLQKEFGYRLGRFEKTDKRHVFPLRMVRAEKTVDQCVLLLGNAAHTLHPIAAQGFNLALYEVAAFAEEANRQSISAARLWQISEKMQSQQSMSIGVSHRLPRLFAGHSLWMSMLSQLCMMGFDMASPIKRKWLKRMLGMRGHMPRLLLSA